MKTWSLVNGFVVALLACPVIAQDVNVALKIDHPPRIAAQKWPVTFGVPFAQGQVKDVGVLAIVDSQGNAVPCQITSSNQWPDKSLRWGLVDFTADLNTRYFVRSAKRPIATNAIQLEKADNGFTVRTGGATYTFRTGKACFDQLHLDKQLLIDGGGDSWFAIDSENRRGVLRSSKLSVELEGPLHTVLRVEGEYLTSDNTRIGAGIVYYHFYAGFPWAHISHKFIVTEDTNKLWFKDIGLEFPLKLGGDVTASFNTDHGDLLRRSAAPLKGDETAFMVQDDFPHFAAETSHFAVRTGREGKWQDVASGKAAGDWADVSSASVGLAVQVPQLAEMFPKAIRISSNKVVVKLWSGEEGGKELDFRTPSLMKNYFGNDWIPADHALAKAPNNASGTAKTHDIWLYPHAGALTDSLASQFAATRDEIFVAVDPAHLCASGVMGQLWPEDRAQFPKAEEVMDDLYQRGVLAGERIFPSAGYLHWGMYPYSAQPWEIKNGRWYPTLHRLSRSLEYNLKRHVWSLYGRSGRRTYFDYARRYTRFMHDIGFSNWDPDEKTHTKGRLYQGSPFESPIVWAHKGAYLAYASSEDVIQFVYDYFLRGDYHSRDMVRWWKDEMIRELNFNVDDALKKFYPTVVFLRMLGSAYELDHDQRLYDYGHKILQRTVDEKHETGLNDEAKQNFSKAGDTFSVFYYYWVSTGDELALVPLLRLAEFDYRWARFEFGGRSSAGAYAYALKYRQSKDPVYLAYLRDYLRDTSENTVTIKKMGVDFDKLNQKTTTDFGHVTLTGSGPVFSGLPVAMASLATSDLKIPERSLPIAQKGYPTQRTYLLLNKPAQYAVDIDIHINNWGDREIEPKLLDLSGKRMPLTIVQKHEHREMKPPRAKGEEWQYSPWYYTFETNLSYRLQVPAELPAGAYQLDVGSHVTFTVQHSSIDQFMQVAPDGMPLIQDVDYWFVMPSNTSTVQLFAHRPIHIYRPDGTEVKLSSKKFGWYEFEAGGNFGAWRLRTGTDKFGDPPGRNVDTFVRFLNIPMVLAQDDQARLFDADTSGFKAIVLDVKTELTSDPAFVPSPLGQGVQALNGFAEVNIGAEAVPRGQGTVEFWYRPMWSATDVTFESPDRSTHRGQYLVVDPVRVEVFIDPDNAGRTGRYSIARLDVNIPGLGSYVVRHFFRAGEWYHVAATWKANGKDSDVDVFINGRRRSLYSEYTMKAEATGDKLAPSDGIVRFGSAHYYNRGAKGEQFDELRISRSIRYTDDFVPPVKPFEADEQTVLLMHLDGDLSAAAGGKTLSGQWKKANRMKN